jgi:hypothetical protein
MEKGMKLEMLGPPFYWIGPSLIRRHGHLVRRFGFFSWLGITEGKRDANKTLCIFPLTKIL